MNILRQRRPNLRIDLSPLIDCVFLLLIFFMLSSSLLSPSLDLTLPEATTDGSLTPPEIVISVDASGQYFLNGVKTSPDRLKNQLRPLIAASRTKTVTFEGDQDSPHKHFVRALQAAQSAGARQVEVAHQPATD
jgi:biopolymer transport protein ExbD